MRMDGDLVLLCHTESMFGKNIAIFIALICASAHTSTNARIMELQFERHFYR